MGGIRDFLNKKTNKHFPIANNLMLVYILKYIKKMQLVPYSNWNWQAEMQLFILHFCAGWLLYYGQY